MFEFGVRGEKFVSRGDLCPSAKKDVSALRQQYWEKVTLVQAQKEMYQRLDSSIQKDECLNWTDLHCRSNHRMRGQVE
jgi:hypothetical protein